MVAAAALGLAADLLTKYLAFASLREASPPYHLIPGIVALRLEWNTGGVFGMGRGRIYLFIIFSVVALAAIVMLFRSLSKPSRLIAISLGIIAGGAMGNLWDRVAYRAVRDFIVLHAGAFHWPGIFNIADLLICVGAAVLIVHAWKGTPEEGSPAKGGKKSESSAEGLRPPKAEGRNQ